MLLAKGRSLTLEGANVVAPELGLVCEGRVLSLEVEMHFSQTSIGHLTQENRHLEKISRNSNLKGVRFWDIIKISRQAHTYIGTQKTSIQAHSHIGSTSMGGSYLHGQTSVQLHTQVHSRLVQFTTRCNSFPLRIIIQIHLSSCSPTTFAEAFTYTTYELFPTKIFHFN